MFPGCRKCADIYSFPDHFVRYMFNQGVFRDIKIFLKVCTLITTIKEKHLGLTNALLAMKECISILKVFNGA